MARVREAPVADRGRLQIAERVAALDWTEIERSLWEHGRGTTVPVLEPDECAALASLFDEDARFRSTIQMARHRFGEGEYRYFAAPLPGTVQELREALYPPLAAIANGWMEALGSDERYPSDLGAFLARCWEAGQQKPTPLLLRYETGGYNALHQDLYGDVAFPMQVMVPLSRRGVDYGGGEFLLVEQRPRAQSVGQVVTPGLGELVVFTTRVRPVRGSRGYYRVNLRHGVSRVTSGTRTTLGIIFHDAA
jgi:hypothetical protein